MNRHIAWIIYYWNEIFKRYKIHYNKLDNRSKKYIYKIIFLCSGVVGFNFIRYIQWKRIHSFLIYPFIAFPSELMYPLRII